MAGIERLSHRADGPGRRPLSSTPDACFHGATRMDLLAADVVTRLRAIGSASARGARHAAWAIEAFDGDDELATAALTRDAALDDARRSLEYVRSSAAAEVLVPRWEREIARLEALIARRPRSPVPPVAITAWCHERLGIRSVTAPDLVRARKMGRRRVHVEIAHVEDRAMEDPVHLADRVALATDAFPIGDDWRLAERPAIDGELAYAIAHDLAYRTLLCSERRAAARARRFLDAFGRGASVFANASPRVVTASGSSCTWTPLTHATFDRGVAVVDAARQLVGIVYVTGED